MIFKRYIQKRVDSLLAQERQKLEPELRATILKEIEEKHKTSWKEDCEFLFNDGKYDYFKYKDEKVIPLTRLKNIHATQILLDSRLSNDELSTLIEIGVENAEKAFNEVKQSNRIGRMEKVFWAFTEMKQRKERLMFHPTLLIELAAWTIIREDEEPGEVNMSIHEQKIELFRGKGGEIPFLLQGNIGKALIKPEKYLENITALWELTKAEVAEENEMYKKILTNTKLETT
jgi:hypothetical protein